jgi:acetoacetyl-CoA reductase
VRGLFDAKSNLSGVERMTQRVAVVTGGTGGLGSEICKMLAHAGRRVIAADLPARMTDAPGDWDGLDIHSESVDVGDFDLCGVFMERVRQQHGSFDILVNNAGITRDSVAFLTDDAAGYVTGANIPVNGGLFMSF